MKIIELAADTDLGKQRKDNQDTFICLQLWSDDQGLIGVIDGVGGYTGGEIAAGIARESIEFYMSTPKGDALSMLREAVVLANNQIIEARERDVALSQMCCVLTVAVADAKNQVLYYVHVGDTRLYRFRNGQLDKITRDHSLVGVREDAGTLTEEEAMQHPRRNVILRQVGTEFHRIDDPEFLESGEAEFLPGDVLMICSDGLSDMITRDQIIEVLNKQVKFPAITGAMISLANDAGGHDNITVVVAKNLSQRKQDTASPAILQQETNGPENIPAIPETTHKKSPKAAIILSLAAFLLVLFLILMFTRKETTVQLEPVAENLVMAPPMTEDTGISRSPNRSGQAILLVSPLDSLISFTRDHNRSELLLENLGRDTIMLSHPIALGQITKLTGSRHRTVVLIPDSISKTKTAIDITGRDKIKPRRDTVYLKNLVITGFETGVHVEGHLIIHLDRVYFNDTKNSVSYKVIDSVKSGYLTF